MIAPGVTVAQAQPLRSAGRTGPFTFEVTLDRQGGS